MPSRQANYSCLDERRTGKKVWTQIGNRNTLVIIAGPTAAGKTSVGIEVCLRVGGEVISADSMQVYKLMDIGTAKPKMEERRGIAHHMLDVVYPDEPFSVARYQQMARECVRHVFARGKVPVMVGGTGLYIRSVIDSYEFVEEPPDHELRSRLLQKENEEAGHLYTELAKVDPTAASKIHPNDHRRLIRALEVFYKTGRPISAGWNRKPLPYDVIYVGITGERAWLYDRINMRVSQMFDEGLVDEVRMLLNAGYTEDLASMQALGYKEVYSYLRGRATLAETMETVAKSTRRFAKRQYTWFNADSRIEWMNVGKHKGAELAVEDITRRLEGRAQPLAE